MKGRILITGGAGFIGSHLGDELLARGYSVRALDNLSPQVHPTGRRPAYLHGDVELICGDLRDRETVERALRGVCAVYHFAAAVGVGQSMYEIERYTAANTVGTAVLLEALARNPVERLVVASSMSVYGEGLYRDRRGSILDGVSRSREQLAAGRWECCDAEGLPLAPAPTPETKKPELASVYALSKYHQEQMCLMVGRAYGIPTVALRLFNVFGARQALSNPYTGVLAIFAARYLNGRPPIIFEDGLQKRDFVSVRDVTRACVLALASPGACSRALNVGSGRAYTVLELALAVGRVLGREEIEPEITGQYRVGDIRHCFADITLAPQLLGYAPAVALRHGLEDLAEWLAGQVAEDRLDRARRELARHGLTL